MKDVSDGGRVAKKFSGVLRSEEIHHQTFYFWIIVIWIVSVPNELRAKERFYTKWAVVSGAREKSHLACNHKARISLVGAIHESPLQAGVPEMRIVECGLQKNSIPKSPIQNPKFGWPMLGASRSERDLFLPCPCQAFMKYSIN
jgi:hypothetical protein